MSKDNQPIFPRPIDKEDELYQEVKQTLEAAEKAFERAEPQKSCSVCEAENLVNARFCSSCGKEMILPQTLLEKDLNPVELEMKKEEFVNKDTIIEITANDIHFEKDLNPTSSQIEIGKKTALTLDYEEWRERIPWLIIGGIIGFLLGSVIILTIVLLIVAIR